MGGNGAVLVNDFSGDNLVLQGAIPGTRTASTVFFLGYFDPGRGGSSGDGSGQYIYSYGADGPTGSQLDFQIDDGRAEIYGGGGTQDAGDISGNNGVYTVYRVESGGGGGDDWAVYADGGLVGSGNEGTNYSVSGDLILFGYQNGSGVSGGYNFVGNVGELLIYDGNLDSTDIGAVESYLMGRLPSPLDLQVNKTTGQLKIVNNSVTARDINFYEIGDGNSNNTLNAAWDSLSDQGIDPLEDPNGATPGAGNDPGETWTEAGGSNSNLLGELYLQGSTNLAASGGSVTMADGFTGGNGAPETLVFEYAEVGAAATTTGTVSYVTSLLGDMNADDVIDDADIPLFVQALVDRAAYNALGHYSPEVVDIIGDLDGSGTFDLGDVGPFKTAVLGAGSASGSAVPEPSTLVLLALGLMAVGRRRK